MHVFGRGEGRERKEKIENKPEDNKDEKVREMRELATNV